MKPAKSQVQEFATNSESAKHLLQSGTVRSIVRKVESDMTKFDLEKKKKAAATIEEMKKNHITH